MQVTNLAWLLFSDVYLLYVQCVRIGVLLDADYLTDPDVKHVHCGDDLLFSWLRLPLLLLGLSNLVFTARQRPCRGPTVLCSQLKRREPHSTPRLVALVVVMLTLMQSL